MDQTAHHAGTDAGTRSRETKPWAGWRLLAVLTAAVFVLQLGVGALVLLDMPRGRDWEFLAWASVVTGLLIGPLTLLATRFVYGRRLTNRQLVTVLLVMAAVTAATKFLLVGLLFLWWLIPPLLLIWAMLIRAPRSAEEQVPGDA